MDVEVVCQRLGLELVEVLRRQSGGSTFVGHVRSPSGDEYVLKQLTPLFGVSEIPSLRTLSDRGITPRFISEVGPNLYLAEWLPGRSLADVPVGVPVDGEAIGVLLRRLHRIDPPVELPAVRDAFLPEFIATWTHLPIPLRTLAEQLNATLLSQPPLGDVFLHGDLVPANVMLTPNGVRFIDPHGRRGLPAWDLAQLAVSAAGRGRTGLLFALRRGYGADVPLLAEMFAWMVLHYLNLNLAAPASPFLPSLQRLTSELVEAGSPAAFLDRYLASDGPSEPSA